MKKYFVAASIAIAATFTSYAAAHAQTVVIDDGDSPDYHHHRYYDGHDDRGWHRGWDRTHFQHARCMTRMETIHRHGHTVTRETRVCK